MYMLRFSAQSPWGAFPSPSPRKVTSATELYGGYYLPHLRDHPRPLLQLVYGACHLATGIVPISNSGIVNGASYFNGSPTVLFSVVNAVRGKAIQVPHILSLNSIVYT